MKIRLSITLAFGFLLAVFGLFNTKPVEVVLLGVTREVSSVGMLFLYAFLTGVLYAGIIAGLGSIRLRGLLSRKTQELDAAREKHEETLDSLGYTAQ